jgi:iron complex outermembrane receptor protein
MHFAAMHARVQLLGGTCLSLLAAGVLSTGAHAQAAPAPTAAAADDGSGVQEITVTAQRRSESIQRTPISVSAFNAETLKTRQMDSVIDVARNVPNVSLTAALASPSSVAAFIRGAGQANAGFAFTESAVGIYVDDVYHARLSGTNLEFNDVERIEVLRGPQGTLYGRNNLTGAIKIVRKEADGTTFGTVEGGYGSRDYNEQKGTFSTAIVPDKLAVIVSGFHVRSGNYYDAVALNERRGERESYGGRVGLSFFGGDNFEAKANVTYTHDKGDGAAQINFTEALTERGGKFGAYVSPVPNFGLNKQFAADFTATLDLGGVKLKSITAYIRGNDQFRFDVYGGSISATTGAYIPGFDRRSHTINRQFTQEFQVLGSALDDKLNYIAGLYYFHEEIDQRFNDTVLGYQVLPDTIKQTANSYAAFGQLTYKFTDRLSATAGLRYTDEKKSIDGTMSNGLFLPVQTLTAVRNKASFHALSPKVEVDFQVTPGIFTYASFSRGFQSGGFNASAVANPTLFRIPYGEQTVSAWEGGAKMDLLDRHLRVNLDYFYNRFGQLQTNAYIGNSVVTQNAGTAAVHGPEAEVTVVPMRGVTLYGSGSRTFDRYIKLLPTTAAAMANADQLPRVSKWQAQVGFTIEHSLGDDAGSVHLGGDYSYRSSYNVDPGLVAISQIPSQELVNGAIGWRSPNERLDVTLSAKNLTNNRFYVTGSNYGVNRKSRIQNEPRLVKIAATYSF